MNEFAHQAVMMSEVEQALALTSDSIVVDGTYGRGGHSRMMLSHLQEAGLLLAIDKDPDAIKHASALMAEDTRFRIEQGSFAMLKTFCDKHDITGRVNAMLLDLGVSSPQLDDASRGFSFNQSGPLDMRMDPSQGQSAADWIASADAETLAEVFKTYGEERFAKRIANAIVNARNAAPITTTNRLAEIIAAAHPRWEKHKHPATRCFQAIRIFINHELDDLRECLQQSLDVLALGGRLVVLSFHSLEDRMVKQFIQKHSTSNQDLPIDLPIRAADLPTPRLKRVAKAKRAADSELVNNRRARSAILRIAEKVS